MDHNISNMLDGMVQANEKVFSAAADLTRMATRAHGMMVRGHIGTFESCLDAGARHLRVATETQDPKEAFQQHTEVALELGEKLVAAAQEAFEMQVQARDELVRWVGEGVNAVKAEAESALKPAVPARRTARTTKKAA